MNLTEYIQSHDESTSQCVCLIHLQVNKCKYSSKDEIIRDQLFRGTRHTDAKEHILDMEETTLSKSITICHKFENIAIGSTRLRPTYQIQEVNTTPTSHKKPPTCRSCGRDHDIYPAVGTSCGRCGKEITGHPFAIKIFVQSTNSRMKKSPIHLPRPKYCYSYQNKTTTYNTDLTITF